MSIKSLSILAVAAAISITGMVSTSHADVPVPAWKSARLGRTWYRGSFVNSTDTFGPRLNPIGAIEGEEFYNLAKPLDRVSFDRMMLHRGNAPDTLDALYADYLKTLTQQVFAVLRMNRLVDQEAVKRGYPLRASSTRVDFVARSILSENAILRDKVPTRIQPGYQAPAMWGVPRRPAEPDRKVPTEDMIAKYSDADLYAWLQEAVGNRPVRFNVDWSYSLAGLDGKRRYLDANEGQWPQVALGFQTLPATIELFKAQITDKLLPTVLGMSRQQAWADYVRTFMSATDRRRLGPPMYNLNKEPTPAEMQKLYAAIRETAFKVQALSATSSELVVSGEKASVFVERYNVLLGERQTELLTALFPAPAPGSPPAAEPTADEQARLRAKIIEYRKSTPVEILTKTLAEFAEAVTQGKVKATLKARRFETNGVDPTPDNDEIVNQQARAVFNPMFESMGLFPTFEVTDRAGAVHALYLEEVIPGATSFLSLTDARVKQVLVARIQGVRQGSAFRDAAYELLKYSPFEIKVDTCTDPAWPCLDQNSRTIVETLFPERLLPGEALPASIRLSTFGHPELLGRVAEISLDLFSKVFTVPDAPR